MNKHRYIVFAMAAPDFLFIRNNNTNVPAALRAFFVKCRPEIFSERILMIRRVQ